ncbi:MAG: hypothetical protein HQ567_27480 [Candidatus Nealsonbacteria bacterium]|nr:hypothetical protein [Candidatus Nealsonbacteria bacterium]
MAPRQNNPNRIEALRRQIVRVEQTRQNAEDVPVASGCSPLDRLLGNGGFRRGTLVEWLAAGQSSGAETLALTAAREACRQGGTLVVLDARREFYPPAAVRLGIELQRLVVVHPTGPADAAWALDQALRCPGVAAAVAWAEKVDGPTLRRWQLAAEQSGALGLLIRPESARHEPSWAEVRLLVEPLPVRSLQSHRRRSKVHLLRCRRATGGRSAEVEIDDETRIMHLATQLAHPTPMR